MKINHYSCMGFIHITYPHKNNSYRLIPCELTQYLKYNKEGNVCGHVGKIPIEYKNLYMKLRIMTIQRFEDEKILQNPIILHAPNIIINPILDIWDILSIVVDGLLILYYGFWYKKTKGKYFKECYLYRTGCTVSFGKENKVID